MVEKLVTGRYIVVLTPNELVALGAILVNANYDAVEDWKRETARTILKQIEKPMIAILRENTR